MFDDPEIAYLLQKAKAIRQPKSQQNNIQLQLLQEQYQTSQKLSTIESQAVSELRQLKTQHLKIIASQKDEIRDYQLSLSHKDEKLAKIRKQYQFLFESNEQQQQIIVDLKTEFQVQNQQLIKDQQIQQYFSGQLDTLKQASNQFVTVLKNNCNKEQKKQLQLCKQFNIQEQQLQDLQFQLELKTKNELEQQNKIKQLNQEILNLQDQNSKITKVYYHNEIQYSKTIQDPNLTQIQLLDLEMKALKGSIQPNQHIQQEALHEQNQELQKKILIFLQEQQQLQNQIYDIQIENQEIKISQNNMVNEYDELQNDYQALIIERDLLKEKLEEQSDPQAVVSANNAEAQQQIIDSLQSDLKLLTVEASRIGNDLQQKIDENQNLQNQFIEAQDDNQSLAQMLQQSRDELSQIQTIQSAQLQIPIEAKQLFIIQNSMTDDNIDLEKLIQVSQLTEQQQIQIENLQQLLKDQTQENENQKQQIYLLSSQYDELKEKLEEQSDPQAVVSANNAEAQQQIIDSLQSDLKLLTVEASRIGNDLQQKIDENQNLQNQFIEAQDDNQSLAQMLQQSRDELSQIQTTQSAQLQIPIEAKQLFIIQNSMTDDNIDLEKLIQVSQLTEQQQIQIENLQQLLKDQTQENENQKQQIYLLSSQYDELKEKLEEQSDPQAVVSANNAEAQQQIIDSLQSDLKLLTVEASRIGNDLQQKIDENQNLQNQFIEAQDDNQSLAQMLQQSRDELSQIQTTQSAQLQIPIEAKQLFIIQNSMTDDNIDLEKLIQVSQLTEQQQIQIENLQQLLKDQTQENENQKQQIYLLSSQYDELKEKLEEQSDPQAVVSANNAEAQQQIIDSLQSDLKLLTVEASRIGNDLQQKIDENQNLQNQFIEAQDDNQSLAQMLQQSRDELSQIQTTQSAQLQIPIEAKQLFIIQNSMTDDNIDLEKLIQVSQLTEQQQIQIENLQQLLKDQTQENENQKQQIYLLSSQYDELKEKLKQQPILHSQIKNNAENPFSPIKANVIMCIQCAEKDTKIGKLKTDRKELTKIVQKFDQLLKQNTIISNDSLKGQIFESGFDQSKHFDILQFQKYLEQQTQSLSDKIVYQQHQIESCKKKYSDQKNLNIKLRQYIELQKQQISNQDLQLDQFNSVNSLKVSFVDKPEILQSQNSNNNQQNLSVSQLKEDDKNNNDVSSDKYPYGLDLSINSPVLAEIQRSNQ